MPGISLPRVQIRAVFVPQCQLPPWQVPQGETRGSAVTFDTERQNKAVLDGASPAPMILGSSPQIVFLLGKFSSFLETGAKLKLVFNSPQKLLKRAVLSYCCPFVNLFSFLWNEPHLNAGGLQLSHCLRSHGYFMDSTVVVVGSLIPHFSPAQGHRESTGQKGKGNRSSRWIDVGCCSNIALILYVFCLLCLTFDSQY